MSSRASDRKDSTPQSFRRPAALRDFRALYVRFGSIATEEAEAARPRMSALRPKADLDRRDGRVWERGFRSARCGVWYRV